MKLTSLLLLCICLHLSAASLSQTVTLKVKNQSLSRVLESIEKQTGYLIIYNDRYVNPATLVTVDADNKSVEDILDVLLAPQSLTYFIKDKTIAIRRKEDSKPKVGDLGNSIWQQKRVTGKVTDEKGEPLPGALINIKGEEHKVVTSANGSYTIMVSGAEPVLVFSYIGFESQEIKVGDQKIIDVKLSVAKRNLEQVVVIGYGSVNKKDVTGSVGSVDVETMTKAPVANFDQALAGRVAGVSVTNNDGQPGTNAEIVIRGGNSLTQSNAPLYVIDGFPMEDFSSSAISPNDIASISVLKDASATAIYGSRGANGVIVIETKKGSVGKPVITYDASVGLQGPMNKMELLNGYEFVKYQSEIYPSLADKYYLNDKGKTLEDYRDVASYNWQDKLFRTAPFQIHNMSLRGGNVTTKYSISGTIYGQDGIIVNSGSKRYQGRASIDQTISKKIKAGVSIGLSNMVNSGTPLNSGLTSSATSYTLYRTWGYRPVTASDINLEDLLVDPETEGLNLMINPVISLQNEVYKNRYNDVNVNGYLNYEILNGLSLRVTGGVNNRSQKYDYFFNSQTYQGTPKNPSNYRGSYGGVRNSNYGGWLNENTLTYNKRFNKDHIMNTVVGFTMQHRTSESYGLEADNIPIEELEMSSLGSGTPYRNTSTASYHTLASFLSRVNYTFKGKYLFTASFRADGSSKFMKGNRWGYFPSGAFAWKVKEESFLKKVKSVSEAKLRLGYGVTGNNRVGDFDQYPSLILTDWNAGYSFKNGVPSKGAILSAMGNSTLKWESTAQTNIGIDLGLFANRISLTADAYRKKTTDLLLLANLPRITGFTNAYRNIGSVENKGLEFALNTVNIRSKNFTWESNFNISFNRNKILSLSEGEENLRTSVTWDSNFSGPAYIGKVGYPAALFYGYVWDGNYQYADFNEVSSGSYQLKGNVTTNGSTSVQPGDIKYRDINGDLVVNSSDLAIIGNPNPIHVGGFNNTFSYKNFSLSVLLQWSYGNDLLNANRLVLEGNGLFRPLLNQFASYANRWTPENQNNTLYRSGGQGPFGAYSSRVIEDGSFLRVKTAQFAYKLPSSLIKKAYLTDLVLNITAQNLFTITNYSGMDPEVSTRNSPLTPGFDYSAYPLARTIVFGINAKF